MLINPFSPREKVQSTGLVSTVVEWSFIRDKRLDNSVFRRKKPQPSFLLEVDAFYRLFLLNFFLFSQRAGIIFLVLVLSSHFVTLRENKVLCFCC